MAAFMWMRPLQKWMCVSSPHSKHPKSVIPKLIFGWPHGNVKFTSISEWTANGHITFIAKLNGRIQFRKHRRSLFVEEHYIFRFPCSWESYVSLTRWEEIRTEVYYKAAKSLASALVNPCSARLIVQGTVSL